MSQTTIHLAANDPELQARIQACVNAEAIGNPEVEDSAFTKEVLRGYANLTPMYWAVAVETEAAYAGGILNGRGSPGHDQDVVTDEQILSAVKIHWPTEPVPPMP